MKPEKEWIWDSEAALCDAFIRSVPAEWIVYPETCGWDIVLVHREGGFQIGVEAKLKLNAKVLVQAMEPRRDQSGPDFRAVLVGGVVAENAQIAARLGLTVIAPKSREYWAWPKARRGNGQWDYHRFNFAYGPPLPKFHPDLPEVDRTVRLDAEDWYHREDWHDFAPMSRLALPEYVPEVKAGVPSPIVLSNWKIAAMRVCIWVEKNTTITRAQFKDLKIDPSRWMNGYWLAPTSLRGVWKAGPSFPAAAFRREHPNIFAKIEADFPEWSKKVKL